MSTIEVYTEDRLQYNYYPVTSNCLNFRVKARKDAHIVLSSTQYDSEPCYEIFFGGWENSKSVIRKNRRQPDVCEVATPNILNEHDYRSFWIRWEYGSILAGVQGDPNPILRYQDPQLFPIQFFGVCTGWGATGHWIIDSGPVAVCPAFQPQPPYQPQPAFVPGTVPPPVPGFNPAYPQPPATTLYPDMGFSAPTSAPKWLPASNGSVPPNAVAGGRDCSGETIYVARASHEGAMLPGKLVPSHGIAYVAWGGRENPKDQYEVLCDCSPRWVPSVGGQIPPGAFPGGQTENGETLYIGKADHEGSVTPGKVQPSHGVCYIPFGGEEVRKQTYEILVL